VSLAEQYHSGGQLHYGENISWKFVITSSDGAEVLKLIEEALDEVPTRR
jgi:hypothetical protein